MLPRSPERDGPVAEALAGRNELVPHVEVGLDLRLRFSGRWRAHRDGPGHSAGLGPGPVARERGGVPRRLERIPEVGLLADQGLLTVSSEEGFLDLPVRAAREPDL